MKVVKHALGKWFITDVRHGQASGHGVHYGHASLVVCIVGTPVGMMGVMGMVGIVGQS